MLTARKGYYLTQYKRKRKRKIDDFSALNNNSSLLKKVACKCKKKLDSDLS